MSRHLDAYAILAGAEPKFTDTLTKSQLISTLNWYSQNRASKDADNYVHQYFKKIQKLEVNYEHYKDATSTFGFVCRIVYNGGVLPKENQEWFEKSVQNIRQKATQKKQRKIQKEEPVVTAPKESVQDRIKEKTSEFIGELEGAVDDYILSQFKTAQSPKGIMHDKVKAVHARNIIEWAKRRRSEFAEVLVTKDKQLIEGYSCYSKPEIKKLVSFFDSVIAECVSIIGESVKTRKPRKRKVKTPEELVSGVKVCLAYPELNLKSVPTKEIIGATQLWVYNTKYKKLGVYHAQDAQGFVVKGTTILNFDENKSLCKTVRKPAEVLPEVLKGGKIVLRNLLDKINAVEGKLTGRLNEDVVLLRIMK